MVIRSDEIRVKIDEKEQREMFSEFIRKFKKDFSKASYYLGISNSNLSKYKRCATRYIPKEVLVKLVDCLKIEPPKIIEEGSLTDIRRKYMHKAHPVLKEKYGKNWAKELTIRRDFKGVSLEDFPDNTFVYLEEKYRKRLFKSAYNLTGSLDKLSKTIKVSPSRLSFWYAGEQKDYKRNKIGLQFIPLSKLKLISELLVNDNNEEFSMGKIEKNTVMYRMRAGNPIRNPNFPIKESPELTRLLFHLLGDGYCGNKSNSAGYKNTCPELLEEFKNDLKVFGNVPIYEQKDSIKFPRLIAGIIKDLYQVNPMTFESRISDKIMKLPKRYLYQGIKAFADDEATVCSSSIRFTSANPILLKGIKEILGHLNLKDDEIKWRYSERATYGKIYYLEIKNMELFYKKVSFTHPKKKNLLEFNVKRKRSNKVGYYEKEITNKKIVKLLKSKPMTVQQLAYSLNISISSVSYHLKKLKHRIKLYNKTSYGARLLALND